MGSSTMDPPMTPPRGARSPFRQGHRRQKDARIYASPPKTPMWRSETTTPATPTPSANASRKRGRDDWTPPTPISLPRCKRGREAVGPSAERAVGDLDSVEEVPTRANTGHARSATTSKALVPRRSLVKYKPLHLGFVLFWDADIIGVHCPFCLSTESHLMRPPINENGPYSNPIWHKDMRAADCRPELSFRVLFPYDRLAMSGLGWEWAEENARWETSGLKDILDEELGEEGENSTSKESICSGDQDFGDHVGISEDMEEVDQIIPRDEMTPHTTASGVGLSITISDDDDDEDEAIADEAIADEPTPKENQQILQVASRLYNKPPPEYLSFSHGQASVIYRPVAVIPVLGASQKAVGFLVPTEFSTRRVFTRSGWRGEVISDADIAWLQGILATTEEAPWQELTIVNNRDYTDKVRELSEHLNLEPKYHNYDKENPLGQVCFSHVEKQLVVVALEEYQPSTHLSPTESLIKRTVYLDRAPCAGCLDFAKAVEQRTPLRFTFVVMTRVMSDAQAHKKYKRDVGNEGTGEETDDSEDDESPEDHRRQGSSSSKTMAIDKERQAASKKIDEVYEISAIVDRRTIKGDLQYLVEWKEMWLSNAQFETEMRGLYAEQLHIVCELTGSKGERRRLVRWDKNWMSYGELYNSEKLVAEFERERGLLEQAGGGKE